MKRVFDHIRQHMLEQKGIIDPPAKGMSYEQLRKQECGDGFPDLMDNRLIMGYFRYGPFARSRPLFRDLKRARECLNAYERTGNTEYLVDAANYARCEFSRGRHPQRHFKPGEEDHSKYSQQEVRTT